MEQFECHSQIMNQKNTSKKIQTISQESATVNTVKKITPHKKNVELQKRNVKPEQISRKLPPKASRYTKRKSDMKGGSGPPKKLPSEELGQQILIEQAILVLAKQHEETLEKLRVFKGIWDGCLEIAKEEISDKLYELIDNRRLGSYEEAVEIYRKSVPRHKDWAIISEARRRLGTRVFETEPFGRYIDTREEADLRQAMQIKALKDPYSLVSNLADDNCWYIDHQLDKILTKVYKQNTLQPGEEDPFKGITSDVLNKKVLSDKDRPALERFIDQRLTRLIPNIKNCMMETIFTVKDSVWLAPAISDRVEEIGVNCLPHKKSQRELHHLAIVTKAPSLRQLLKPYQIATAWLLQSDTHRGALLALTDGMQYEDLLARNGCIVDGKQVLIYPAEEFGPDKKSDEISEDEEELSEDSEDSFYDSSSSSRSSSPYYTRERLLPYSPRPPSPDIVENSEVIEID